MRDFRLRGRQRASQLEDLYRLHQARRSLSRPWRLRCRLCDGWWRGGRQGIGCADRQHLLATIRERQHTEWRRTTELARVTRALAEASPLIVRQAQTPDDTMELALIGVSS